eukprot:835909-Rhodomonas_salina.1
MSRRQVPATSLPPSSLLSPSSVRVLTAQCRVLSVECVLSSLSLCAPPSPRCDGVWGWQVQEGFEGACYNNLEASAANILKLHASLHKELPH